MFLLEGFKCFIVKSEFPQFHILLSLGLKEVFSLSPSYGKGCVILLNVLWSDEPNWTSLDYLICLYGWFYLYLKLKWLDLHFSHWLKLVVVKCYRLLLREVTLEFILYIFILICWLNTMGPPGTLAYLLEIVSILLLDRFHARNRFLHCGYEGFLYGRCIRILIERIFLKRFLYCTLYGWRPWLFEILLQVFSNALLIKFEFLLQYANLLLYYFLTNGVVSFFLLGWFRWLNYILQQ
jgi:hypothetical protein